MVPKSVLPPAWEVPSEFRERLGERVGRQRAMLAEGHLLLVLHRPPKKDETERFARLFWRKPDGTWQSNELGNGPTALARHLGDFAEMMTKMVAQCFAIGAQMASSPGVASSRSESLVQMSTTLPYSGLPVPSQIPGISRN